MGRRSSSSGGLTAMAVAAAAEATAQYQSSLVEVEVDNESEATHTIIIVRAPDRPYLMGDMSGALSGLGLAVREASITSDREIASLRFALQEPFADGVGGRKVVEKERVCAIEQRIEQRFRGRQGLNGGSAAQLSPPHACTAGLSPPTASAHAGGPTVCHTY